MNRLFLIAALALLIAGCNEKIDGVTCETDADCPGGKCDQGVCFEVADAAVADASVPDASEPDAGPKCTQDSECGTCEKCSAGACVFQADGEDLKDECPEADCATGTCDGAGACGLKAQDTPCRTKKDDCDRAEVCTGVDSECPADKFEPSSHVCRTAAGDCDVEEKCTGSSAKCPDDQFEPSTTVCKAAVDICDKPEMCPGDKADCPIDAKQPQGTECGPESCTQGTSTYTPPSRCDTAGVCQPATPESCHEYRCGSNNTCKRSCDSDADCTENLCDIRSNHCAPGVKPVDCTGAPAKLQTEIDACASGTPCYLRVSGTCEKILIQDRDVFIAGTPGAVIDPTSDGPAVSVREDDTSQAQTTKVGISLMTIRGASGPSGYGVECAGLAGGHPTIFVANSNIRDNAATGLRLSEAQFSIENCVVAGNGTSVLNSEAAGVRIDVADASGSLFVHNTVAHNGSLNGNQAGVRCVTASIPITNSIVWANAGAESVSCGEEPTSQIEGSSSAQACGAQAFPEITTDYHLNSSSPCIDAVACVPEVTTDIDGESRPQRSMCDVGADEVP